MKILKKPTKKDAGIAVDDKNVYHFLQGNWVKCGDCKLSDEHIIKLL